jgi:hypothetical protein
VSYDVDVGDESFNMTSNMSKFFVHYGVYPPELDAKPALDVAVCIEAALQSIMATDTDKLDTFDDPGGWGNWSAAVGFLREIRAACCRVPGDTVRVSW